ncbi:MAG: thrombospondin type 3 repeat-containing protein [Chitinophagaceae bacterium]|nr:thrombospondin type 3 repeat-containing protein [Chitinophagaceae bacterium]
MRKIDAVLLSALIIYDYSAQSLVDSDSYSLGQALTSEATISRENSPANSFFAETPGMEGEDNIVRSVKHMNTLPASVSEENTISYHELAKINSIDIKATEAPVQIDRAEQEEALPEAEVASNIEAVEATEAIVETVQVVEAPAEAVAEMNDTKNMSYTVETVNADKLAITADPASLDSDGDGIYDYEDKCQGIAGVARFEGCPVPDSDGDGVNDEEDRCPGEAGLAENGGCPAVAYEAIPATIEEQAVEAKNEANTQKKNLQYFSSQASLSFNDAVLTNEDFNIVLQFADILIRQQEVKVEISAAKDNTNINYLVSYLKELGVNSSQVVTSTRENNVEKEQNKVYMHLKL